MQPAGRKRFAHSTDHINFIYGCSKVSPGCKNCYIARFKEIGQRQGLSDPFSGEVAFLNEQNAIKKLESQPHNALLFVNALGDTFHDSIPDEARDHWIYDILEPRTKWQFFLLTKRPQNMVEYFKTRTVPDHVWVGTSIESKQFLWRLDEVKKIQAKIRYVGFEPLLEDLGDFDLRGIAHVGTGGETEPLGNYRPFKQEWAWRIKEICDRDNVAFFYLGGNGYSDTKRRPHLLRSNTYENYPDFDPCKCGKCTQVNLERFGFQSSSPVNSR